MVGSHSSTLVPTPLRLWILSAPPSCDASPCTIDRPSPVPLPTPFVEKKGSMARASVASSMPEPVSDTESRTYSPGARPRPSPRRTSALVAEMRSVPPFGMASRAFTLRLSSAISSWFWSALANGRSSEVSIETRICGPDVLAIRSAMSAISLADVDGGRLQGLSAREGEQPLDEGLRPLGGLQRRRRSGAARARRRPPVAAACRARRRSASAGC